MMKGPFVDFSLYLITDRHQSKGKPLKDVVHSALQGGVTAVQLREKDLSPKELFPLAVELRELTRVFGAKLFINDRVDLALAVNADGVHLPADSFPVPVVRKILGEEKLIGVSTHNLEEVKRAELQGANFVTLGPIYFTPSKAQFGQPLGPQRIAEVKKETTLPIFALGGIKKHCVQEVMERGAHGVGVISAILGNENVKESAMDFRKAIKPFLVG